MRSCLIEIVVIFGQIMQSLTAALGNSLLRHPRGEGDAVSASGVSLDALRLILAMAVRITGAQGAMLTRLSGPVHTPLVSVDLSHSLITVTARQLSEWQMVEPGTSLRLLQFRNRGPMFAICTWVPQAKLMVSFLMTEVNLLDRCSIGELEGLAEDLAGLVEPVASAMEARRIADTPLATCCMCEQVQNDKGQWMPWQQHLQDAEHRMLSHTFCPHCMASHYPELMN